MKLKKKIIMVVDLMMYVQFKILIFKKFNKVLDYLNNHL